MTVDPAAADENGRRMALHMQLKGMQDGSLMRFMTGWLAWNQKE
jgi:hypothetical protein